MPDDLSAQPHKHIPWPTVAEDGMHSTCSICWSPIERDSPAGVWATEAEATAYAEEMAQEAERERQEELDDDYYGYRRNSGAF